MDRKHRKEIIRNFIFGVEDSLVSTVGLVSGITIAGTKASTVFLTGMVLIFVEAFSMGIGSLLSAHGADSYENHGNAKLLDSALYAVVMFFSYLIAGFFIILPYLFFHEKTAVYVSISVSVVGLFILGLWSAKIAKMKLLQRGFLMAMLGGAAIVLGVVVGQLVSKLN